MQQIKASRISRLERGEIPYPIPRWYNPYLTFAVPNGVGLLVVYAGLSFLTEVGGPELLAAAVTFVLANFTEYAAHRWLMHRSWCRIFFRPHTLSHHEYFSREEMAVTTGREVYKVLLFPWAIVPILVFGALITLIVCELATPNIAAIAGTALVGYFILYEGLHLLYHAPTAWDIEGMPIVGWLQEHHARHHDRKGGGMKRNFNLVFPLWDVVLGTLE